MPSQIDKSCALIVVDVQNDFCSGGALAVPEGDLVISILNQYISFFQAKQALIIAIRDWHPMHHVSFQEKGGPWPPHCVQYTRGADFHKDLKLPYGIQVISKGFLTQKDAYSGFEGTELKVFLEQRGIRHVYVGGLATDYCVKNTVLDAMAGGFDTYLLEDAVRAVNVQPEDGELAVRDMLQAGAQKLTFEALPS